MKNLASFAMALILTLTTVAVSCSAPPPAAAPGPTPTPVAAAAPTAGGTSTSPSPSAKPLTTLNIGSIESKTGANAQYGQDQPVAVDMAVQDLNNDPRFAAAGYKFQAIHYDNGSDAEQVPLLMTKAATQDKVILLVGPVLSVEILKAVPTNAQLKVPWVVTSVVDSITTLGNPYVFRFGTSYAAGAPASIKFTLNKSVPEGNVGVLYVNNDYGNTGAKAVEAATKELGRNLAASVSSEPGTPDYTPHLLKLKQANVKIVFLYNQAVTDIALVAKQAKQLGLEAKWDLGYGINPQILQSAGADIEGWYGWITFYNGDPDPKVQAFVSGFKKITGRDPGSFVPGFYDGVKRTGEVVLTVGPDTEKIKAELENTTGYVGVAGTYTFTPKEHTGVATTYIVQVSNGQYKLLGKP